MPVRFRIMGMPTGPGASSGLGVPLGTGGAGGVEARSGAAVGAPSSDRAGARAEEGAGTLLPGVGVRKDRAFELPAELDDLRIGRQPGIEIELPFPAVSSQHARLFRGPLPGDWWVEDLGSTNGTWLDGRRLGFRSPVPIRAGQRLRIATTEIVFDGWSATAGAGESTATLARRLISDLFGAVGGEVASLAVEGEGSLRVSGLALVERDRRYIVGRADGCDLVLPGEPVSREHAAVVRRWDGVFVRDLGSRNGLSLNGVGITGEARLADGDRITIGASQVRLSDPEDRYLRRIESLAGGPPALPTRAPPSRPGSLPSPAPSMGAPVSSGVPTWAAPPRGAASAAEVGSPATVMPSGQTRAADTGVPTLMLPVLEPGPPLPALGGTEAPSQPIPDGTPAGRAATGAMAAVPPNEPLRPRSLTPAIVEPMARVVTEPVPSTPPRESRWASARLATMLAGAALVLALAGLVALFAGG